MTDQSILNHIDEALRLDKEATPGIWQVSGIRDHLARSRTLLPLLASDCASLMERVAELEKALAHNVLLMGLAESEANKDRITAADELAEVTRQRDASDKVLASRSPMLMTFGCEPINEWNYGDERAAIERYAERHRAKQQPGETR